MPIVAGGATTTCDARRGSLVKDRGILYAPAYVTRQADHQFALEYLAIRTSGPVRERIERIPARPRPSGRRAILAGAIQRR